MKISDRQVISWSECQVIDTGDEVTVQRMDGMRPVLQTGTGSGHREAVFVFNIYRTHAAMCTVTDQEF